MTLQPLPSEFPYIRGKFFFISANLVKKLVVTLSLLCFNIVCSCLGYGERRCTTCTASCSGCLSPRLQRGYNGVERADFQLPGTATQIVFASIDCAAFRGICASTIPSQRIISLTMATNRPDQIFFPVQDTEKDAVLHVQHRVPVHDDVLPHGARLLPAPGLRGEDCFRHQHRLLHKFCLAKDKEVLLHNGGF